MEKSFDVLLINPSFNQKGFEFFQNIPPDLVEVGSYLISKGIKVKLADCSVKSDYIDYIKELGKDVILVGLGVMNAQIASAFEITEAIKSVNPKVKFVWGGPNATLYAEQTLEHKYVDFIIKGEGEEPLYNLYMALKNKKSYEKILGLGYKKDGKLVINPPQPLIDVDKMPSPDWSLIDEEMLERFRSNNTQMYFPVSTSRGCPHRCSFCINVVTQNRWRGKSPEKVVNELSNVYHNLGISKIRIRDELFFVSIPRVKAILKGLIANNVKIQWQANSKADYFRRGLMDEEVLDLMNKTNCEEINIGAESGSQRMLDLMHKDGTVEDILITAKTLQKYGIRGLYSFMIGLPFETKKEMIETIKVIKKIKKLNPNSNILGPQPYRPYPGGEMFNDAVRLGWKSPQKLEDWPRLYSEMEFSPTSKFFPWIEDPVFVDYLLLYTKFASNNWKQIRDRYVSSANAIKAPKLFIYAFAFWCKLRWTLGIYDKFYEIKILEKYYRKKIKNKPKSEPSEINVKITQENKVIQPMITE